VNIAVHPAYRLRAGAAPHVRIVEVDAHINDPAFAETAAAQLEELLSMVRTAGRLTSEGQA
jgi:hypothetical protein